MPTLNSTSQPAVKSGQIPVHFGPTAISGINHNLSLVIEPTARFASGYSDVNVSGLNGLQSMYCAIVEDEKGIRVILHTNYPGALKDSSS